MWHFLKTLAGFFNVPVPVIGIFIVFIIFFVFICILRKKMFKKIKENWAKLAEELGLSFEPKAKRISGKYKEREITVSIERQHSRKGSRDSTMIVVPISNPKDIRFRIYPQYLFDEIGKKMGWQDIEFQDSSFDQKFVVKTNNEIFTREILNYQIREKLIALEKVDINVGGLGAEIDINKVPGWMKKRMEKFLKSTKADSIVFEEQGIITDSEKIRGILDTVIDLAIRIEKVSR